MIWEKVKLSRLCKMTSGGTPSRSKPEYFIGNIPWAKISDIEAAKGGVIYNTEEQISIAGLTSINNRIFAKGTLLLAMYGSVGKVAFAGVELSTNQAILGLNIIDETVLTYSYLKYWFDTIKVQLLARAVGGTLQNISLGIVRELEIPLPPIETQKNIVNILDNAGSIRQRDRQLLHLFDALAETVFISMFGDPIKNNRKWAVKKLKDCVAMKGGGTPNTANEAYFSGNIPWVSPKDMKSTFINSSIDKITELAIKVENPVKLTTSIRLKVTT